MIGLEFEIDHERCKECPTNLGWEWIEIIDTYLGKTREIIIDNEKCIFYEYIYLIKAIETITEEPNYVITEIDADDFLNELANGCYKLCK